MDYRKTLYTSCMGYVTQAIVNSFAPLIFLRLKSEFGIPLERITLLITLNFTIQLMIDLLSMKIIDRLGYRFCIIAADIFAAAGLISLGTLPYILPDAYAGLICAVVLYALGGGLLEVLVSPIVEACPFDNKAGIMSVLHSFYSWGCVIVVLGSTAFFAVFGISRWRVLAILWTIVPITNALLFRKVPMCELVPEGNSLSIREIFSTRIIWLFVVLMICSGASEQAMSQWASAFAEAGLGVSKTIGDLAGPCMFAVLMGTARVVFGRIDTAGKITWYMAGCGVLCVVSYLMASLAGNPLLGLLGCALCGFSVGIMWPGVISLASETCPLGGTAMYALLALGGDLGCSGGPTLTGLVSGAAGGDLSAGLLTAVIFPAVFIAGVLAVRLFVRRTA